MLVDQARTYQDTLCAVFEHAKTLPQVGPLEIEAMPFLAFLLVLANREGLTDAQLTDRIRDVGDVRAIAEQGTRGPDTQAQVAGYWILRELNDSIPAERAHKNMVWNAGLSRLIRPSL